MRRPQLQRLRLTLVERYGLDEKRAFEVLRCYSRGHSQAYPSSRQLRSGCRHHDTDPLSA